MNAVALAILASFLWGIGTVMQKHGMAANFPKITLRETLRKIGTVLKVLFTNWIWLLGLLFMLGGMGSFATALGAGDITLVQPLACLTGVVAAVIGVVFLKEKVARAEWLGIGAILAGVVLVGMAESGQTSHMPTTTAILLLSLLLGLAVAGSLCLQKLGRSAEFTLSIAAGFTFGLAGVMGKLLTQRVIVEVGGPFSLGRGDVWGSLITDYPAWIVILTNVLGSVFMQTAFANGRASVVSPLITIMANMTPIAAAIAVFGERIQPLHGIGIGLAVIGTAVLGAKASPASAAPAAPVD